MDVITTMTSTSQPVFSDEWLEPGTHINAAGANHIRRRKLDAEAVGRASPQEITLLVLGLAG
jgi:alanine dehydrogenase